jgi:hypothetical protein
LEEHVASIFRVDEQGKQETSVKAGLQAKCLFLSCFGLFFDPEDGGNMFLWNAG